MPSITEVTLIACVASQLGAQTAPATSAAKPAAATETVLLNPFEVSTSKDTGYVAGCSLACGRAETQLRLTPASISVMTREFMDANPDLAGQWRGLIPAGRMGEPTDLVGLVRFLASPESGYLTAQSVVLDGGYTAI